MSKKGFKNFKRKLAIKIYKTPLVKILNPLNLVFFHWKDRMHFIKRKKSDKKYLLIRAIDNSQGIISLYLHCLNNVKWAISNGFIPYIDFSNELCQYYTGRDINGTKNAWEYFFNQPSNALLEEVKNADCVILSGWSFKKKFKVNFIDYTLEEMDNSENKDFAKKYLPINKTFEGIVEKKYKELFKGKVLGVFIRGTDYVQIKPKGHYAQPSIDDVKEKIDEFLAKYKIDSIFVVTEDYSYFEFLKKTYGDMVFSSDYYFVKNYNKNDYVSSSFDNDKYDRGANYLIRLLLLKKCNYLISSLTNGSLFLKLMTDRKYDDEYWFQLGMY